MRPHAETKVVSFPSDVGAAGASECESCGSPKQTDSFCRACAFQLVDVALSSSPEGLSAHYESLIGASGSTPQAVRFRYDHYEICRSLEGDPWELGRGAMGITYKATDTHLNCPVALKIINARRLGGLKARNRFLREARTAASLRHPNIASVFHLGLGEDDCFYAMEYIEGETLEARVDREGPLPYRLALGIVVQCARALRVAHTQHFVHRDIKPTNIMLVGGQDYAEEVYVKLIDFGLVKAFAEEGAPEAVTDAYFAGTPHYASPEQLQTGIIDARSDIYSLGRCLGYMLTGAPIQPASTTAERPFVELPWPILPNSEHGNIPEPVAALLASMVARDPERRPCTADALLDRLSGALAGTDRVKLKSEDSQSGRRKIKAHPRRLLVAFIVLIVTAVFTIGAGSVWRAPHREVPPGSVSPVPTPSVEARLLHAQATEFYQKYTKADNQRAIDLYSRAVMISPSYSEAYIKLAAAYHENACKYNAPASDVDRAIDSAQHAIALDPNASGAYQVLGAIRGYQGRPWDALGELHHALELAPKDASAMCDFSLLWICVGQPQLALPWAKASAQLQPSKIQGWHAAAEASVELCDDQAAEEFYRRCTEIRPAWMSPYCGLMHIHLLQRDFVRARQDYAKAESIQGGLLLPQTLMAQLELFSGDYAAAERCYRRLLTLNRKGLPRYYSGISYLSALGFLRLQAGDAVEGNDLLNEAETLHGGESEGPGEIYDLAAIRAVQNRKEEALLLLEQAIPSGWNDWRATRLDPRFTSLHGEPHFEQMLNELDSHVAEMRSEATSLCSKLLELADYPVDPRRRASNK